MITLKKMLLFLLVLPVGFFLLDAKSEKSSPKKVVEVAVVEEKKDDSSGSETTEKNSEGEKSEKNEQASDQSIALTGSSTEPSGSYIAFCSYLSADGSSETTANVTAKTSGGTEYTCTVSDSALTYYELTSTTDTSGIASFSIALGSGTAVDVTVSSANSQWSVDAYGYLQGVKTDTAPTYGSSESGLAINTYTVAAAEETPALSTEQSTDSSTASTAPATTASITPTEISLTKCQDSVPTSGNYIGFYQYLGDDNSSVVQVNIAATTTSGNTIYTCSITGKIGTYYFPLTSTTDTTGIASYTISLEGNSTNVTVTVPLANANNSVWSVDAYGYIQTVPSTKAPTSGSQVSGLAINEYVAPQALTGSTTMPTSGNYIAFASYLSADGGTIKYPPVIALTTGGTLYSFTLNASALTYYPLTSTTDTTGIANYTISGGTANVNVTVPSANGGNSIWSVDDYGYLLGVPTTTAPSYGSSAAGLAINLYYNYTMQNNVDVAVPSSSISALLISGCFGYTHPNAGCGSEPQLSVTDSNGNVYTSIATTLSVNGAADQYVTFDSVSLSASGNNPAYTATNLPAASFTLTMPKYTNQSTATIPLDSSGAPAYTPNTTNSTPWTQKIVQVSGAYPVQTSWMIDLYGYSSGVQLTAPDATSGLYCGAGAVGSAASNICLTPLTSSQK